MSQFWSNNIDKLKPYTPGEQPQIDGLIKLNTNENPYPPSPKVIEAIQQAADEGLRQYPDPNAQQLKSAIAEHYQLTDRQVFVANSSDEVLAHTFRGLLQHDKPIVFPEITYSFYPVWCQLFDIQFETIALREDFSLDVSDFKQPNGGIIFANPNAPTGLAVGLQEIIDLLSAHPESVLVIDEAYADFAEESAVSLIEQYANLLVVQTLSKSRSLAGLRVGFACGNEVLIEALDRVKNSFHPYALNRLAIAGATAAMQDKAYFEMTRKKVINTRDNTHQQLVQLGFEVLPSKSNFLFIKHAKITADKLYQALREHKILVRYFDKPRINQYCRVSIGSEQEMQVFIEALKDKIL